MPFQCSICGEESTKICARCTKDACDNHLCEKCLRCSDCCECEVMLSPHAPETVRAAMRPEANAVAAVPQEVVAEPAVTEPAIEPLQPAVEPEVTEEPRTSEGDGDGGVSTS
jgi:hypothetical protein